MEHMAAIMMLVGCAEGNTLCRELPAPSVGFETVQTCEEQLHPAISGISSGDRIIYGKCVSVDPALFMEDVAISWTITDSNQLDVDIDFEGNEQIALNGPTLGKTSRLVN